MKRELDLDGTLKDWQAPARADAAWEEQADAIVSKAKGAASPDARALDALFGAPDLAPEPGEAAAGAASKFVSVGDTKMADEKDQGPGPVPSEAPRKRQSLKEMAERAQSASASRPAPSSLSTPVPGRTSSPSLSTPLPSAPVAKSAVSTPLPRPPTATPIPGRPSEAGKDDSGVVDLNIIRETASAEEKAAAEKAKPGQADLLDDAPASQRAVAAAAGSKPGAAKPAAPATQPKKGSGGAVAGIAIAVIGLAAAFAILKKDVLFGGGAPAPVAENRAPAAEQAATAAPAPTTAPAEPPAAAGDPAKEEPVAAGDPAKGAAPVPGGPVAPAVPGAKPADGEKPAPAAPVAVGTAKPGEKPGSLSSEMEKAVGPVEKDAEKGTPEPAAGSKNSNIPEQPPQGSVSAAMAGVMGGAKACVSGADDVSRATVTFSSSGAVSSVSVTGWAASNGAGGCIKSALKGANVGPFSKPSFTVGVTIRP